jgi:hypothetical protein
MSLHLQKTFFGRVREEIDEYWSCPARYSTSKKARRELRVESFVTYINN